MSFSSSRAPQVSFSHLGFCTHRPTPVCTYRRPLRSEPPRRRRSFEGPNTKKGEATWPRRNSNQLLCLVHLFFVRLLLRSSHPPAPEKTPPMSVLPPSAPPSPAPALQSPNPISAALSSYSTLPNTLASPDKYPQYRPSSTAAQSVFSIHSLSSPRLYCPHPPVSTVGFARRCDKLTSRKYATSIRLPCTRNLPVGQSPVIRLARS